MCDGTLDWAATPAPADALLRLIDILAAEAAGERHRTFLGSCSRHHDRR